MDGFGEQTMKAKKLVDNVIRNCDFIYQGDLISKEELLRAYGKFLGETFEKEQHNISIVLHTGSICFDIVTVIFAALSNLVLNDNNVKNVLDSLNVGDMVTFKGANYIYKGIEEQIILGEKSKYAILEGKSKGTSITEMEPENQWHLITPYYGASTSKGGRGRRNTIDKRNKFIEYFTGTPASEIPSVIDTSTVVVMPRSRADEIIRNLVIKYSKEGTKEEVKLLDLVTASYYTESDEYNYSGNSARHEPILKITSKLSVARELIIRPQENRILGLMILEQDGATQSKSELVELLERRTLGYVYASYHIASDTGEELVREYEKANLFACTKEFLLNTVMPKNHYNPTVDMLNKQIDTIIAKQINEIILDSDYEWKEFKSVKRNIKNISDTDIIGGNKEDFVIQASALLNLLVRAPFSMRSFEESGVQDNCGMAITTPDKRLVELKKYSNDFSESLREKAILIIDFLETMYLNLYSENAKEEELKSILSDHRREKIAIIVPKNYFAEVLENTLKHYMSAGNVEIYTANKFNSEFIYDRIIVCGDFSGKRFNAMKCKTASDIDVLLYEFEHKMFRYRLRKFEKIEREYNRRVFNLPIEEYEECFEPEVEAELAEMEQITYEMEGYLDELNQIAIQKYVSKTRNEGTQGIEVTHYGRFDDGDSILFSKNYKPIVFEETLGEVREMELDNLATGDVIIFTKNDNLTKSIVEEILENLIDQNLLGAHICDAYEKSRYWKDVLRDYMDRHDLTYDELGRRMRALGSTKHPVTIRSWIQPFSHIVGPKDEESYKHIAILTNDEKMMDNASAYHEACSVIRRERVKILKLIATSIINSLRGTAPRNDVVLEAVFENVDNLAIKKQIENIARFDEEKNAPLNMVNKPIQM